MKKTLVALALVASLCMLAEPTFAGFTSARSFSSRSFSSGSAFRSYSAPRTIYRPIYRAPSRPAIVQQNVTHVTQVHSSTSSGGGFMSSFAGSMAGSAIGQWLFGHKEQPAPAAQQLVPVDCSAEANRALPVCNQGAK